ncbi:YbhN family protein [Acidiferrimicrobium sp. IK]|uniref:lysylphosphatidylglycerol synthase transmembrane domain-containing protein n=1 Tax=Acidiferrimicrobium sp. IK TaxID=2871700 RepID=UPI0021CAF374|nr:YbhN family protein [Acidiferrimicrobium sp. IK]MCU4185577.1 YbhN family protein [Acidiferrimicrobium sp. IK]
MKPTQPTPGLGSETALGGAVGSDRSTLPAGSDGAGAVVAADGAETDPLAPVLPSSRRGIRRVLPAPVWRVGKLLLIALIVDIFVVPQIAGAHKAWHQLSQVNPLWLLAGLVLEVAAIMSYAQLTRSVLPAHKVPDFWTVLRIQLTTLSVSHCVPGGTAAGSSLGYRLMTNAGVEGPDVGFALGTQALGSAVVLNVILWVALIVSIPFFGFSPLYLTAAIVGVLLLGVFLALALLLTKGEEWATALLVRLAARIPFVDGAVLQRLFSQVAGRLQDLLAQRSRLVKSLVWATANWLLDAASLFVFVGAFGEWVNPDGLLVSFALANVLAAIPLTPGGLGVVEATLTSSLVGFNTPRAIALLGVVSYRLVNFWLPIPAGGLAYLSLHLEPVTGRLRGITTSASTSTSTSTAVAVAVAVADAGAAAGTSDGAAAATPAARPGARRSPAERPDPTLPGG